MVKKSDKLIRRTCRETGRDAYGMVAKHNAHFLKSINFDKRVYQGHPMMSYSYRGEPQHHITLDKLPLSILLVKSYQDLRTYGVSSAIITFIKGI